MCSDNFWDYSRFYLISMLSEIHATVSGQNVVIL